MVLKPKQGFFLAFTAVFAVLAGFVFWGTWSEAMVPVMPDSPTVFPIDYLTDFLRGWRESGKFVPSDMFAFLGSPYLWVEFKYVLAVYCAALGMFYFLRGRGLSRPAAYGAGLLLAFSGYWLTLFSAGHGGWFVWMTYGVFAFGLIDRAFEKGKIRHWLFLGACLAWGSFYQSDLWLLFTVFSAAYFLFRWLLTARAEKTFLPRRWICGMLIALASFVLVGAPSFRSALVNDLKGRDDQIASGVTVTAGATGDEARWEFVTNWSLPPEDTLEFFISRIHGDTSCPLTLAIGRARGTDIKPYTGRLGCPKAYENDPKVVSNYRQHSLYVGALTCLLALAGLFSKRRSLVLFFAISAIVFYLFSLGRYCESVYRLVYALPMGDYLRAPVKWHHLTEFCLVVLAGLGLDALHRLLSRFRWGTVVVCFLVLIGACDLANEAHRFCAPHRAGYQLVPYRTQQGVALMDVRENPPPVRKPNPLPAFPTVLAVLSVLATFGVLVFPLTPLREKRLS